MNQQDVVTLKRDVEATEIPSGRRMTLYKGTELRIMQSLGGTFTVVTHQGAMSSISGRDADAINREVPPEVKAAEKEGGSVEERVWNQLRTCYDPEIPHNIVDLGLIYECRVIPAAEGQHQVHVKMTLTAPGCGMGEWLKQDARTKILGIPGVQECNIEVVFDPPWNPSMMSKALRREMGM